MWLGRGLVHTMNFTACASQFKSLQFQKKPDVSEINSEMTCFLGISLYFVLSVSSFALKRAMHTNTASVIYTHTKNHC